MVSKQEKFVLDHYLIDYPTNLTFSEILDRLESVEFDGFLSPAYDTDRNEPWLLVERMKKLHEQLSSFTI